MADRLASESAKVRALILCSNRVCLDFVNSLDPRKGERNDFLRSYADFIAWSEYASLISSAEANELATKASHQPEAAEGLFRRAIDLREMLYRLFFPLAHGQEPAEAERVGLQRAFSDALPHARMTRQETGFDWVWPGGTLEFPLWRLTHDAVDLLRTAEPARLKECANPLTCGWLFYDTSKNNSRRWCVMAECGVPEKVRRQRRRRASTTDAGD